MSFELSWASLAFASKKPLNELKATFIAAPREISSERFVQLVKEYLPSGNIVIGIADEPYILGFEGQPQFATLNYETVRGIIKKVNNSASPHKITVLRYSQRDTKHIFEKIKCRQVVLVRGSWQYSFHVTEPYYALVNRGIPYVYVSPFASEAEAQKYAQVQTKQLQKNLTKQWPKTPVTQEQVQGLLKEVAKLSFDPSFQTGAVLTKKKGQKYELLDHAHNDVVPYETYAMHHGLSRDDNFAPPNDLNHYDTVHAEVGIVVNAQKNKQSLKGTTIFINLMPCPHCARMLCETDIQEIVYQLDHSDGYAFDVLTKAGKTVRRITS